MILLHHPSAVNLWVLGVRQACFSSDFRRRSRSTRFTSVLSHASVIREVSLPSAGKPRLPFGQARFPPSESHTLPSASEDGMTKHNFVKLVWNVNDRLYHKSIRSRLFRAAYNPIDRRLFAWCIRHAPLFTLISSFGGAETTGCSGIVERTEKAVCAGIERTEMAVCAGIERAEMTVCTGVERTGKTVCAGIEGGLF